MASLAVLLYWVSSELDDSPLLERMTMAGNNILNIRSGSLVWKETAALGLKYIDKSSFGRYDTNHLARLVEYASSFRRD